MGDITVGQIKDGKYTINGQEVSKEEYFQRKAEEQQAVREKYAEPTPGLEDLESFAAEVKSRKKPVAKKAGGAVKSASARADGIAQRGKTRGRMG